MTDKELQELIRLKRFEQPEEGYFEDFLQEFQQRQRSEMLKTSAGSLFVERVKTRFSELGSIRWVIGVSAAVTEAPLNLGRNLASMSAEAILNNDFTVASYKESDFVGFAVTRSVDFTDNGPVYLEDKLLF